MVPIIESFDEIEKYIDKLKQIRIWLCSTSTGKTYMVSIDDRFYDLDSYRTKLKREGYEDFEDRTIPKMYEILDKGMFVLNASHTHIMNYLYEKNIPFVFVYSKPESEPAYIKRMLHRGSGDAFVRKFAWMISAYYTQRREDNRPTIKIELGANEYICDYLWKVFGKPKKYIRFAKPRGNYKIAFVELENGLLNRLGKLSAYTKKAIKELKDKIKIVLVTNKNIADATKIMHELDLNTKTDYAISGNKIINGAGEQVYLDGSSENTKLELINKVLKLAKLEASDAIMIGSSQEMPSKQFDAIALCNAKADVKKRAKYIGDSNNDNGTANALEKILKG